MNKYKIEGDINFYEELLKDDDDDKKEEDEENVCLLTGLPLLKNHIKLPCTHTFNYDVLFNEVYNQKQFNEYNIMHVQVYDVKCPYCRNVSHNLLPYIPIIKMDKIHGVNCPDKYTMNYKSCSYQFLRGKKKGEACNDNGFETDNDGDLCEKHWKKSIVMKKKKVDAETKKQTKRNNNQNKQT
jgi:hypothetical protein